MDLHHLVNPHVAPAGTPATGEIPADLPPMRIRRVTLSPAEEYAARPGQAETIPDALAALILSRKAFVEVGAKGVLLDRKELGGKRRYWHPDSPLCNPIGKGEKTRVVAVWNNLDPSHVHLFDGQGRYLETLPSETQPAVNDPEAIARELAAHRRVHARYREHLQRLHADDSEEALDEARANTAEIRRVVSILPADNADGGEAEPTLDALAAERGEVRVREAIAKTTQARRDADALFDRPAPRRETAPVAQAAVPDPFDL